MDSDLDGIASAVILYKFLSKFYPDIEVVYSIHTGKQHGLSKDIIIDKDTTLVWCPDSGSNDKHQCEILHNNGIDVICLDHHIIERTNPYAAVVNCMDGEYPNTHICGSAVTWLFLWGFCHNCISFFDEHQSFLLMNLDLVAVATISDVMEVTNEDNMFFIQTGLRYINSEVLIYFTTSGGINPNEVSIEDVKFKIAPLISAMIRMGSMSDKKLLFRAFIDDYEEFEYEKRGSLETEIENIYSRVVRLCKNAKSRQDRAKQKLLDGCQVHEYDHVLLVSYEADKQSTLTGLVANELANQYCKPCIVYRETNDRNENGEVWFSGSARNYDGSPIDSFKDLLVSALQDLGDMQGHANAFGCSMLSPTPQDDSGFFAHIIEGYIRDNAVFADGSSNCVIGEREYQLDFSIPADKLDYPFVNVLHTFDYYSGYGFPQVTALVTGIKVTHDNFKTMGKNSYNWKIYDGSTGVSYIKFKVDKNKDELIQKFDDLDFGEINSGKCYVVNAICTFGLNTYLGDTSAQAIIKDYEIVDTIDNPDAECWDLDFDILSYSAGV